MSEIKESKLILKLHPWGKIRMPDIGYKEIPQLLEQLKEPESDCKTKSLSCARVQLFSYRKTFKGNLLSSADNKQHTIKA